MNKESHLMLRLLVCGYLVYLALDICKTQMSGSSAVPAAAAYAAAALMGLSGAGFALYHLKQYRDSKKTVADAPLQEENEAS